MSFHKFRLTLSPEAQKDFTSILRYTGERWGHAQLLTYRNKLNGALMLLGGNPQWTLEHRIGENLLVKNVIKKALINTWKWPSFWCAT